RHSDGYRLQWSAVFSAVSVDCHGGCSIQGSLQVPATVSTCLDQVVHMIISPQVHPRRPSHLTDSGHESIKVQGRLRWSCPSRLMDRSTEAPRLVILLVLTHRQAVV